MIINQTLDESKWIARTNPEKNCFEIMIDESGLLDELNPGDEIIGITLQIEIKDKERSMNKRKRKMIIESYDRHDENDISDGRLLQMVADDCKCGVDEVVKALIEEQDHE